MPTARTEPLKQEKNSDLLATKEDLLNLASIDLHDEFIGFLVSFLNQSHEFLQFEYLNYYMHVTFFVALKSVKKC